MADDKFHYKELCWEGFNLLQLSEYDIKDRERILKDASMHLYVSLKENLFYPYSWLVISNIYGKIGRKELSKKCRECYDITSSKLPEERPERLQRILPEDKV